MNYTGSCAPGGVFVCFISIVDSLIIHMEQLSKILNQLNTMVKEYHLSVIDIEKFYKLKEFILAKLAKPTKYLVETKDIYKILIFDNASLYDYRPAVDFGKYFSLKDAENRVEEYKQMDARNFERGYRDYKIIKNISRTIYAEYDFFDYKFHVPVLGHIDCNDYSRYFASAYISSHRIPNDLKPITFTPKTTKISFQEHVENKFRDLLRDLLEQLKLVNENLYSYIDEYYNVKLPN